MKDNYHISDDPNETNQAWVRNKFTPILNFFCMIDDISGNTELKKLTILEKESALNMIEIIKKEIEKYK